jgi:hypothetical protein
MWPFKKKASVPSELVQPKPKKTWKLPKLAASRVVASVMWLGFLLSATVLFIGYRNVPMNYVIMFVFLFVALAASVWRGTGNTP